MLYKNRWILVSIFFVFIISMGCASASDDFISSSLDDSDNDLSNGVGISSVSSASDDSSNTDSPISLEDIQDKSIVDNDGSFSDNSSELNTLNMPSKYDNSKIGTRINAKKVSAYYKEKANLNISLKDSNNNVLKNKQVKILLKKPTIMETLGFYLISNQAITM